MEIDIRNSSEEINSIRFASGFGGVNYVAQADVIYKDTNGITCYETESLDYVSIFSKQHAENLIKALEKAIDLGWLK